MTAVYIVLAILLAFCLVYVLLLRCRCDKTRWEGLLGWRYAHRGLHDKPTVPENSLAAFRAAIAAGYGAELDVHLLSDGTLAVFHDHTLKRCAGVDGEIEALTKDELSKLRLEGTDEHIPTFDEVLALFESKAPLVIELKNAKNYANSPYVLSYDEMLLIYRKHFKKN